VRCRPVPDPICLLTDIWTLTLFSARLPSLDKFAAILETVLTWCAAYPASVAFGQVLLQTAPPQRAVQIISLNKSLREVEAHPLFVYLKVRPGSTLELRKT
jgi:hypothetical protein